MQPPRQHFEFQLKMKIYKSAFKDVKQKVGEFFAPEAQYGARPVVISGFQDRPWQTVVSQIRVYNSAF